jgi:hypothetical protein
MSTFTPNLQLEEVARGGDVGTWDTPTNSNWSIVDLALGGIVTIALNNTNVVLSAAQYQAKNITFNSTLTVSVTITFPTSFSKSYEITGSFTTTNLANTVTLKTTVAGGLAICVPLGQTVTVFNDGASLHYTNLPPVGTFVDIIGSATPPWITGCTLPPYLNCDGSGFNTSNFPILSAMLGGGTLPDCRGTVMATLDQGAGRLTIFGGGTGVVGDQNLQQHAHSGTTGNNSVDHSHTIPNVFLQTTGVSAGPSGPGFSGNIGPAQITGGQSVPHNHAFNTNNTGVGGGQNVQPTSIYGIRMIRTG